MFLGFAMSVLWIYTLADEIVGILRALGIVADIDAAVLGLTVLAWGNSIGDLITDCALAKAGMIVRFRSMYTFFNRDRSTHKFSSFRKFPYGIIGLFCSPPLQYTTWFRSAIYRINIAGVTNRINNRKTFINLSL